MGMVPPVVATLLADTKEYQAKMDESIAKMDKLGAASKTTSEKMAAFGAKAATAVVGLGAALGVYAVDQAYKYNEALDLMQRQTNLTGAQMDYLRGQLLTVSTSTATSATVIASGETQLIKSGESLRQSLIDVGQAAKYSQANNIDLNSTLTAAIGIQKQHIAGTNSISQTLDIFTTALKNSQLRAGDLNTALGGRALSAFAAYHIDLKSAVTILAGFADQNLVGARSTLVLKTGLAALEKPAETAKGKLTATAIVLKSVGLNMDTLAAEIRKPGGALNMMEQLSYAFDHNASSAMKAKGIAAFLQQIFGTSAGPAFTNIINELPKLMTVYNKMNSSTGATNNSFAQWLKSPGGAVASFKTTLENSAIRLGDVLLPKLTVGLIDATRIITGVMGTHSGAVKLGETIAEGIFSAALGVKLVTYGLKFASAVGLELGSAAVAVPIGAAIGLAILAIIKTGHGGQIVKGVGEIVHPTNLLSPLEGMANVLGAIGQTLNSLVGDVTHNVPVIGAATKWLFPVYNNPGGNGSRHHNPGESSIHHRVTVRVTR